MDLTSNMLAVIEALAENKIQDAKQNALRAYYEDKSKKNKYAVGVYYIKKEYPSYILI